MGRPAEGWATKKKGGSGLEYYVIEFESSHRDRKVAACDRFEGDACIYVLFFEGAGLLVGVEQFPKSICLYA
jgi:hypothetical protein